MFDKRIENRGETPPQKPSFWQNLAVFIIGNRERKDKIETIKRYFTLTKDLFEKEIKNPEIPYDQKIKDLYYGLTSILELIDENNLEISTLQKNNERTFLQDLTEMGTDQFWNKKRNQLHSTNKFTIYIKKYLQDLEKRLENLK